MIAVDTPIALFTDTIIARKSVLTTSFLNCQAQTGLRGISIWL